MPEGKYTCTDNLASSAMASRKAFARRPATRGDRGLFHGSGLFYEHSRPRPPPDLPAPDRSQAWDPRRLKVLSKGSISGETSQLQPLTERKLTPASAACIHSTSLPPYTLLPTPTQGLCDLAYVTTANIN